MDKTLYVKIDLFSLNQNVMFIESKENKNSIIGYKIPTKELSNSLLPLANQLNANIVELEGNKDFIEPIGNKLLDKAKTTYSNKVRIKINGKILN